MPGTTTRSRGRIPVAWRQLSAEPAKLVVSLTAVAADITSQHAVRILGAPPTTERKWADAGRIPHVLTRGGPAVSIAGCSTRFAAPGMRPTGMSEPKPTSWFPGRV